MLNSLTNIVNTSGYDINKCCARLASNLSKQCSYKQKYAISSSDGYGLCTRHQKIGINNITTILQDVSKKRYNRNVINNLSTSATDKLVKIQSVVRKYLIKRNIYYRGISVYCRHLCSNKTDCTTLSNIEDVPNNQYYSYASGKQYWGFNIATFKELLKYSDYNPYNTCKIECNVIAAFNKLLTISSKNHLNIEEDVITDPLVKLQQKCVKLFQIMDQLKQYTQCSWFLDLNLPELKSLYKHLEDIWNYRVVLSLETKKKYVKNGTLFTESVSAINKMTSRLKLANLLLDNFQKLITEGADKEFCTTGALWILSGLTIVSKNARDALPWLYQSAHPGA